jgi:hypothetical protein
MLPWFNKKEIEPFDDEYIYPGNEVYSFILNDIYIPARININKTESEIRSEINPVPYYWRNWQSLIHKQNSKEFAMQDWWSENKHFVALLITAIACVLMVTLSAWFTIKYSGGQADKIIGSNTGLADAIRGLSEIPGK